MVRNMIDHKRISQFISIEIRKVIVVVPESVLFTEFLSENQVVEITEKIFHIEDIVEYCEIFQKYNNVQNCSFLSDVLSEFFK